MAREEGRTAAAERPRESGAAGRQLNIDTILRDLKKDLFMIICLAVAAGLLSYIVYLRRYSPAYTVESTYVVTAAGMNNSAVENLKTANLVAEKFSRVLTSGEMQKAITKDMGTSSLGGSISASIVEETNLLQVRVRSGQPRRAFQIMHSITNNIDLVLSYLGADVRLSLLVAPTVPQQPDAPLQAWQRAVLTGLGALALLLALCALLSYLRDTVRSGADIEERLGTRYLGSVCHEDRPGGKKKRHKHSMLITRPTVSFPYTEGMHKLSRKVQNRMKTKDAKVLLVTSVNENEGKSTVASNLALSLAENGKKVLLVDADMRKPSLYKIFDVEEGTVIDDLGRVLLGTGTGENLIRLLSEENICVIFNTKEYGQSTEMLSNGRMEMLLSYLRERFDYIILDAPPMNVVADAEVMANYCDASLMVVREHFTGTPAIRDALDTLRDAKAKPIGCVLNDAHTGVSAALGGYQYGSDYGYRYSSGYGRYYGRYYGKYGREK